MGQIYNPVSVGDAVIPGGADGDLQINNSGAFGTIDGLNLGKTGNARGTGALDIQSSRSAVTRVASGSSSTAIGSNNTASGSRSSAFGNTNTASGGYSTASGYNNTASGSVSLALGYLNTASAQYSTASGYYNTASGSYSTAVGSGWIAGINAATGNYSTAVGFANTASSDLSTILGANNTVNTGSNNGTILGADNTVAINTTNATIVGKSITNSTANSVEIGPSNTAKIRVSSAGLNAFALNITTTGALTGSNLSGTNTGDNAVNTLYSGLITNATHTGEVTGSGALTVNKTAITGQDVVTADDADYVLISDTSDSGNLKKALKSDFGGGGGSGDLKADGTVPLTANWDVGNYDLTAKALTLDGTLTIDTTTVSSITSTTYPVVEFTRSTSSTNAMMGATRLMASTPAGSMVDGFGVTLAFTIQDNAVTKNNIATINAVRAGADNTGDLYFTTYLAGTPTEQMRISSTGAITTSSSIAAAGAITATVGNVQGLTISSSNSGFVRLTTTAGGANSRNWGIVTEYNAEGLLEILRSTTEGGVANTTALSIDRNGDVDIAGSITGGSLSVDTATFVSEIDNGNATGTDTIDWTAGNKQKSTLTGNCTFTFTAPTGPCSLTLKATNFGAFTPTWPATVKWAGGTEPTWTASGLDIATFYYDGTSYHGAAALDFS